MSKHTPGPWYVTKPKHGDADQQDDRLIHTEDGRHIAETYQYQNQAHHEANGEAVANANLMATAPELLQELEALWQFLDGMQGTIGPTKFPETNKQLWLDWCRLMDNAQQAIAKATP